MSLAVRQVEAATSAVTRLAVETLAEMISVEVAVLAARQVEAATSVAMILTREAAAAIFNPWDATRAA